MRYKSNITYTQKEAVELYHKAGMSTKEISERLGCPETSVRGRLSEIRKEKGA